MQVYADNAATTKISSHALQAMMPCFETYYGNPSSLHTVGQEAKEVLDQAIRYNMVLDVKLMIITNGTKTVMCMRTDEGYRFISNVPKYLELL